jgi:hypothetical protein
VQGRCCAAFARLGDAGRRIFQAGPAIAQEQRSKSWQLRAATSLCSVPRQPSERGKARRLVTATYDWFTEGHETADLRAARVALAAP